MGPLLCGDPMHFTTIPARQSCFQVRCDLLEELGSATYPVARHGLALDFPLLTISHMKYSVPDCGIFKNL